MRIRKISEQDYDAYISVIQASLDESVTYGEEIVNFFRDRYNRDYLKNKISNGTFYVAVDNEQVIGLGGIEEGWIKKMFIHPNRQSEGIGGRILEQLEDKARAENRNEVFLYSFPNSIRFYQGRRYSIVEDITLEMGGLKIRTTKMKKEL